MKTTLYIFLALTFLFSCKKYEHTDLISQGHYYIENGDTISTCFIPTAFTPQTRDGINDEFKPIVTGYLEGSFSVKIYSQNSDLLFSSSLPENGWDGTYHGGYYQSVYASVHVRFTASNGNELQFESPLLVQY